MALSGKLSALLSVHEVFVLLILLKGMVFAALMVFVVSSLRIERRLFFFLSFEF